jgi:hypothetical protein
MTIRQRLDEFYGRLRGGAALTVLDLAAGDVQEVPRAAGRVEDPDGLELVQEPVDERFRPRAPGLIGR